MIRWQPPPADAQNGEIIGYKIRYRKGTRKSEVAEITSGSQLYQLIDGKLNNTSNSEGQIFGCSQVIIDLGQKLVPMNNSVPKSADGLHNTKIFNRHVSLVTLS